MGNNTDQKDIDQKNTDQKEVRKFDAEVGKVLRLVIHSLYTNKDIFLRELLSNASDACDKLRYLAQTDDKLLGKDDALKVSIRINEKDTTLIVEDSGIGMDKDDIINNIGNIAKSGTQRFIDSLTGNSKKDIELIGQFGVGFYSAFMVSDKITIYSCKAGNKSTYKWESNGEGEYSIEPSTDLNLTRGTRIILHLKENEKEFLDKFRIQNIAKTYSDHISLPIELITYDELKKIDNIEVINSSSALWTRNKSDISEDEYKAFYKTISHSYDDPWLTMHNKVEGKFEYTSLLFVPTKKPFDLYHPDRKTSIKLYVNKVFITEDNAALLPQYLRFIKGIVDSSDITLNISRETLQNDLVVNRIKDSLTKKILGELKKKMQKDPEGYMEFIKSFGPALKEGLCEHSNNKDQILELCKFYTTKSKDNLRGIDEYIKDMKDGQKDIYYLLGDDIESMKNSPQLELFQAKDVEVILFSDPVDHFFVNVVNEYKQKSFKSVTKTDDDLDNILNPKNDNKDSKDNKQDKNGKKEPKDKLSKEEQEKVDNFVIYCKEILKDCTENVRVSHKLTTSPVCLAASEGGMDIRMERILIEQKQLKQASKKIFEINIKNKVIKSLIDKHNDAKDDSSKLEISDYILALFDSACITEGEPIRNSSNFIKRINALLEAKLCGK